MDPLTLAFLFAMALATSTLSGAMGMGGGIALVGAMAAVLPPIFATFTGASFLSTSCQ